MSNFGGRSIQTELHQYLKDHNLSLFNHCCPNLGLNGIGGGSHKGLDLQVLFDGLEKKLNLPSVLVNGGDGRGAQLQVIGQKSEDLFFLNIIELDPAQGIRTIFGSANTAEDNEFVFQNGPILRDVSCFDHSIDGISFRAGYKGNLFRGPFGKQVVIVVAAVVNHNRAGIKVQQIGHLYVVTLPVRNYGKRWQIPVVIQKKMQLHRPLGPTYCAIRLRH